MRDIALEVDVDEEDDFEGKTDDKGNLDEED
jgi:hypothetical protein